MNVLISTKQVLLLLIALGCSGIVVVVEAHVRGSSTVNGHSSNDIVSCNAHLHAEPCTTTWSQLFGTESIHTDTVVIPCGKCIVMDFGVTAAVASDTNNKQPTATASSDLTSVLPHHFATTSSSELTLESGLDIQGKLVFHDGYGLDLVTPQIVVQGELNVATWTTSQQLVASSTTGGGYQPTLNITFRENMQDGSSSGSISGGTTTSSSTANSYMRGYKSSGFSTMSSPGTDRFIVSGGKVIVRGNHDGAHQNSWMIVNDSDNAKKVLLGWVAPVSQGPVEDNSNVGGGFDEGLRLEDDYSNLMITTSSSSTHNSNTDYLSSYVPPRVINDDDVCNDYLQSGILFDYDFSILHTTLSSSAASKPRIRSSGRFDFAKQGELFNKIHESNYGPEIAFLDNGSGNCLELNRPYLVTARIEMPTNKQTRYTNCARFGVDCISLLTTTEQYTNNITHWEEQESHQTLYGNILTIATTITFHNNDDNTKILIRGGPKGIHVLSFTIQLPPKYSFVRRNSGDVDDQSTGEELLDEETFLYPSQTEVAYCDDLVPPNGNAEEAGLHPFPFGTNNPFTHIVVEEDDTDQNIDDKINHYFAISGRRYSMHVFNPDLDDFKASGLSWDIPTPCLIKPHQTGARYRMHADIRIRSHRDVNPTIVETDGGISMEISIRAHGSTDPNSPVGGEFYQTLVVCPPSWDTWVSCDAEFTVPKEFNDPNISRYEVVFTTLRSYSVSYDIDNMSIAYVA